MIKNLIATKKLLLHRELLPQFTKLVQDSGLDKKLQFTYPDISQSQDTSFAAIKIQPFQQGTLVEKQNQVLLSLLQLPRIQIQQDDGMEAIFSKLKELRKKYSIIFTRNMTMDSDKITIYALLKDIIQKVANTLSVQFESLKTLPGKIITNYEPFLNKQNLLQEEQKNYAEKLSYDLAVYILENEKELDSQFKKRNVQLVQCQKEGESSEQWYKIEWLYEIDKDDIQTSAVSMKGYNTYNITELRMFKQKFEQFQKSKLPKYKFKFKSQIMKTEYEYTFTKGGKFYQKNLGTGKVRKVVRRKTKCKQNPLEIKWLFQCGINWKVCSDQSQILFEEEYKKISEKNQSKGLFTTTFGGRKYEIEFNLAQGYYNQVNVQTQVARKLLRNLVPKSKQICYYSQEREFQKLKLRGSNQNSVIQLIKFLQQKAKKDILQEVQIDLTSVTAKESSISFLQAKKFQMKCGGVTVEQRNGQFYLKGPYCYINKDKFIQYLKKISTSKQSGQVFSKYPPKWTDVSKQKFMEPKFIKISKTDPKYKQIESQFHKTSPNNQVLKIQRVQNKRLWQRYYSSTKIQNESGLCSDQKFLFHGTRGTPPIHIVSSEQGLDLRYGKQGMWGVGVYFAVNSSYSASGYSYQNPVSGQKFLFYVRVMIGEPIKLPSNNQLKFPPLNPNKGQNIHYDSVQGDTGGSVVYIIYSNDRCYPQFLITFK